MRRCVLSTTFIFAWGAATLAADDETPCVLDMVPRAVAQMKQGDWQRGALTYGEITRANPYRADHWHNYGFALHKSGQHTDAIRAWERSAQLGFAWDPLWEQGIVWDPTWVTAFGPGAPVPWYNIARAEARLGHLNQALEAIRRALDEGFAVEASLREDPDFAPLRDDARFRELAGWPPPSARTRVERWAYDLEYLARRIEQVHERSSLAVARRRIRQEIEALKSRLPEFSDPRIVAELQRVAAAAGSAHTRLYWPEKGAYAEGRYPVEYYLYQDGVYVRRASREVSQVVGRRVIRLAGRSADEVIHAVEPLCSVDGPMGLKAEAPILLSRPSILEAVGLAVDASRVALAVESAGGERAEVELVPCEPGALRSEDWVGIEARGKLPIPLAQRSPTLAYWFETMPKEKLVYFRYNAVTDRPDEGFASFCQRMFKVVREQDVQNLVIDLRRNGGGNGLLNRALIHELIRTPNINRRGHLFVIIGRSTFSAAVSAVSDLERQTEAIFVGEPTCSGPNGAGQATVVRLPCSGLEFSIASLHNQGALLSSDRRPWIAPDIVAEETSNDAATNRDPALDAIRSVIGRTAADPVHKTDSFSIVRDISFQSRGNTLRGRLLLPTTPPPHPAVVFVHGSGALGRDDWTLHPSLRERLARSGVATLCWDKPGVGESTGEWTEQTFSDRAEEAIDAVRVLSKREEVDPKRIGLWGISQGGWICPLAASRHPEIAFLILVSAPAGTIEEQDLYRVEQEMRAGGIAEDDIAKALAFVRHRILLLREGSYERFDAIQKELVGVKWFENYVHRLGPKEFAFGQKNVDYDGRSALKAVKCPALVIVGERDTIVPAKQSALVIKRVLNNGGNNDVTIKVFPDADHFMRVVQRGGASDKQDLVPEYSRAVVDWVRGRR